MRGWRSGRSGRDLRSRLRLHLALEQKLGALACSSHPFILHASLVGFHARRCLAHRPTTPAASASARGLGSDRRVCVRGRTQGGKRAEIAAAVRAAVGLTTARLYLPRLLRLCRLRERRVVAPGGAVGG